MHEAVHAAEVHEHAEVGDGLDVSFEDLSFFQAFDDRLALAGHFLFDEDLVADNDIFGRMVDLHDAEVHRLADERVEVAHGANVDLRAREERIDAEEIDHDPSFDAANAATLEDLSRLERFRHPVPDAHEVGPFAREDELAVLVLNAFEKHFNLVADLQFVPVLEFRERDRPFRFEADIHRHVGVADVDDASLDDLPFRDLAQRPLIHLHQIGTFALVILVLVNRHAAGETAHRFHGFSCRLLGVSHSSSCCVT